MTVGFIDTYLIVPWIHDCWFHGHISDSSMDTWLVVPWIHIWQFHGYLTVGSIDTYLIVPWWFHELLVPRWECHISLWSGCRWSHQLGWRQFLVKLDVWSSDGCWYRSLIDKLDLPPYTCQNVTANCPPTPHYHGSSTWSRLSAPPTHHHCPDSLPNHTTIMVPTASPIFAREIFYSHFSVSSIMAFPMSSVICDFLGSFSHDICYDPFPMTSVMTLFPWHLLWSVSSIMAFLMSSVICDFLGSFSHDIWVILLCCHKCCSDATMVTWCHNSTIWRHNSSTMATINRK